MRNLRSVVPVVVAWIVAGLGTLFLKSLFGHFHDLQPSLPLVSLPFDPQRDVVSSVPALFTILFLAVLCVLLVEPAKLAVAEEGSVGRARYVLLLLFQGVLAADVFRSYAFDWWKWTIAWLGFSELREGFDLSEVSGFRFPWISGAFTLVLVVLLARTKAVASLPTVESDSART